MRSSSISSSSHKRAAFRLIVTFLALAVVAELGARFISPGFGHDGTWPSNETYVKHQQMVELAREETPIEIVFVGSSMTAFGIDSLLFEELAGRGAYNAGLSAATMRTEDIWAREFVVPLLDPRHLVLAISTLDVGHRDVDRSLARFERAVSIRNKRSPTFWTRSEIAAQDVSHFFRYRRKLRDIRDVGRALAQRPFPDAWGARGERQDQFGEEYEAALSGLTRDFEDYRLGDAELASLSGLLGWLGEHEIMTTILLMPITDDLITAHPGDSYDQFVRVIESFASEHDAHLIDGRDLLSGKEFFSDPVHLNNVGQKEFTSRLASQWGDLHEGQ